MLEVRLRYRKGESAESLRTEFELSRENLSNCLRGHTYSYLGTMQDCHFVGKLSDMQVREIRKLRQSGVLLADLAQQFSVDQSYISRLARGLHRMKAGGPIDSV